MQCIDNHPINIRYMGVGALDISYKGQRILTDPFYSPQTLWKILSIDKYRSNPEAIKLAMGPYKKNVNAVLVGHGHYDHIADLPAIKNYLTDDAIIIGSPSVHNMIHPVFNGENKLEISEKNTDQWHYIANGWVRVKAQTSEHAPQFLGLNFVASSETVARKKLPRYIWSWKQGTNLSYIVDFLNTQDSSNVYKRIFIQTTASNFPIGYQAINDGIKVNNLFLAGASYDNVDNYPVGLLKSYKPAETFFIHWENFFNDWYENPEPLSGIDINHLIDISKKAHSTGNVTIPNPKDCIHL